MVKMAATGTSACACNKASTSSFLRSIQQGILEESVTEFSPVLAYGCVHCKGKHNDTPLILAIRHGHLHVVKALCARFNAPLEVANSDGKRPLHEAAQCGRVECARFLLNFGAGVDSLKRADWLVLKMTTPLMLACTKSSLEMVKLLVESHASLELRNKDGWTPFHIASREGHKDIISYLLDVDSNCWCTTSKNGRTPLHTAVLHGKTEILNILYSRCGYHGNEKDSCGVTPLMDAVRSNQTQAVLYLLDRYKVDPKDTDSLCRNAVHHGAQAGAVDTVKILLTRGVSINCRGSVNNMTPLHYAAKEGQYTMIECLLKLGANPWDTDTKGRTAMRIAMAAGHVECANLLT